jgi:tellurite resistance protein
VQQSGSVRNLPVNLFASVMGLAGLSIAWRVASQEFGVTPLIPSVVSAVAVITFLTISAGYIVKTIKHPDAVVGEFRHPVLGNFFGTVTISILLLSSVVEQLNRTLSEVVWTVGMVSTIVLSFMIAARLLRGKSGVTHAVPARRIPGVATLDITVAGGTMPMPWSHEVNMFALAVGTMIALLFFTMIVSRIIHHEPLAAALTPSLMILMAPFEVGFLAYTKFTQQVDTFAGLLFYFGLFIFLVLAPKVFRKGIPFCDWLVGDQLPDGCAGDCVAKIFDVRSVLARNDDRHHAARHADDCDCGSFGQDAAYSSERETTRRLKRRHSCHDVGCRHTRPRGGGFYFSAGRTVALPPFPRRAD